MVFGGGSARALEDVDRLNRRLALRAFPHSTCPLLASHIASSTAAIGSNHVQGFEKSKSLERYFATFGALDLLYFFFVIRGHVDLPDSLDSDHHRLGGGIVLEPDPVLPAVEQNNSKRASQVRTRAGVQALILILDNHEFFRQVGHTYLHRCFDAFGPERMFWGTPGVRSAPYEQGVAPSYEHP